MHSTSGKISDTLIQHALETLGRSFQDLDRQAISEILSRSTWITLKGGEILFMKGQEGNSLFLLVQGRMKALRTEGGEKKVIGEISQGELLGEMAAISGKTRNADIVAIRDCHLLMISVTDFQQICMKHPQLGWETLKMVIDRVSPDQRPRKLRGINNVAIIPGHRSLDAKAFLNDITDIFSGLNTKIISRGKGSDHLSPPEDLTSRLQRLEWVEALERSNDLLFFLTDPNDVEWSRFCVRQADEIVIVIDEKMPLNHDFIDMISPVRSRVIDKTLIIQHPGSASIPSGTEQYFAKINFDFHFHFREGQISDLQRFKRHLLDQKVGLVLAGGGARGIAHVGVWKAIEELDIPIDWIGGTSMGAFLGGIMALGYDYRTIYEIVKEIALSKPSSDINPVPYTSLILGKSLDKVLRKNYAEHDILDCPNPFFCVSTDITNMKAVVHHRGNMFRAIRASGSLPAIVPPVPIDNNWHVDGGVVDNFPVQEMINQGVDRIIGVSFESGNNPRSPYTEIPSFWNQVNHGLLKRSKDLPIPSIFDAIMLSTTANSALKQKSAEEKVDILITPEVSHFGLLEWAAYDKVITAGYESAIKVLTDHSA